MACTELQHKLNGSVSCFSNSSAASENGKRFSFKNPDNLKICKVQVDGCLINDQNKKKCDYFFSVPQLNKYYLVELKGKHIEIALEQITETFVHVNKNLQESPDQYKGFVVSSTVPKSANQRFKNYQEKIFKKHKLLIERKQIRHTEVL